MAAHKIDTGSGGKRGHSGQDNWVTHQEEKAIGRRLRRLDARDQEREALANGGKPDAEPPFEDGSTSDEDCGTS